MRKKMIIINSCKECPNFAPSEHHAQDMFTFNCKLESSLTRAVKISSVLEPPFLCPLKDYESND